MGKLPSDEPSLFLNICSTWVQGTPFPGPQTSFLAFGYSTMFTYCAVGSTLPEASVAPTRTMLRKVLHHADGPYTICFV